MRQVLPCKDILCKILQEAWVSFKEEKMKLKEFIYLIKYSMSSWLDYGFGLISMLKKPKTWGYILYGTIMAAVYYDNWEIIVIAGSMVLVLYIIRQSKDPGFTQSLKDKAFIDNDEQKLKRYYDNYKKQCFFSQPKREPVSYEDYVKGELEKINEKRYTGMS
jgi:hypothetical protein